MPKRRLKTNLDIRRYLANLINRVEANELEVQKAGRLAYISQILLKALENTDLEERLEALEKKLLSRSNEG